MTTWYCRGRSPGSNAVFRESLAAAVRELFHEGVGASSATSARLPALPVASEGRGAALPTRLGVLFPEMPSESKSVEAFRFCDEPP